MQVEALADGLSGFTRNTPLKLTLNSSLTFAPTLAYPNPPGQALTSLFEASSFNPGALGGLPGLDELDKSGQATATMKRRASAGAVTPISAPFPITAGLMYKKVPGLLFGSHSTYC